MELALQKHDLLVEYKPGKELFLADALSRNFLQSTENNFESEIEQYVHSVINDFPVSIEKKHKMIMSCKP